MGGHGSADAIVVAAGTSARMDGTDKLMADIGGRPVLAHTLAAFGAAPEVRSIVVVTTLVRREALEGGGWLPAGSSILFADGGELRQDSVRSGFDALERAVPDADGRRIVLVHDGARPVVSRSLIAAVVSAASTHGAAIPVVAVSETIKRIEGDRISETIDRSDLAAAQTPQGIRRALLRAALASSESHDGTWTDEAALLEACRIPVHVIRGDAANLKVTVPADLVRADALLAGSHTTRRTGIGHDAHPFGPGEPLRLGGIEIAGAPRLHGHSDGDVVLHAVADALLGAAGQGDLGRLFPPDASTPAGIDSGELLAAVIERLAEAGWRPAGIDLTIVAARPRLAGFLDAMRDSIASLLGVVPGAVSVKASTGNLDGSVGAGRTISTLALATIERRP